MSSAESTSAEIISLADRRPAPAGTGSEGATLEFYWKQLAAGRIMPDRSEVNPAQLGPALPGTFVVERIGMGLARFRLAGSRLVHLAGRELRGLPLSTLFDPDDQGLLFDLVQALYDDPARLRLELKTPLCDGEDKAIRGEMRLLPLRDGRGAVTLALGHLSLSGDPYASAPTRFSVDGIDHRSLIGYGALPTEKKGRTQERPTLTLVKSPD